MDVMSYREHKTNVYAWQLANILGGRQELLLSTVQCRKLSWFGHVCRHDTLPMTILQGTVDAIGVAVEYHANYGRINQRIDRPLDVVIAAHHG